MAGQPKSKQGAEMRTERTLIRWTKTETKRLTQARKKAGFAYESDFVRSLVERGVQEILADEPDAVAQ
jgi:hypothetical protein